MTATEPHITGGLAAVLDLHSFHPSRQRPDTVWIRGRRASGRRLIAILEPDGAILLHRLRRTGPIIEQVPDAATRPSLVGPAIRRLLAR